MLEEDETALGKVLLGATSVCTIYIYIYILFPCAMLGLLMWVGSTRGLREAF